MTVADAPKTVTIPQACDLVQVSRRTIYNWLNAGKLLYVRTAGGSVRIYTHTLFRHQDGSPFAPSSPAVPQATHN
jgi:excisionase family DNA binding protein